MVWFVVLCCGVVYLLRRNPLGPPHQHTRLDFMVWVRSPEVLTRPRASAQGSQTFGIPPFAIVGRDDHLDWLSTSSPKPRHTHDDRLATR